MMRLVCFVVAVAGGSFLLRADAAPFDVKSSGVPRYDAAVRKAVDFLEGVPFGGREGSLISYALLKAGATDSEIFRQGVAAAAERAEGRHYSQESYDHIYLAGIDAMLLADLDDADRYRGALQNIADHVQSVQLANGGWTEQDPREVADVSMSQYGMLALWAAKRAGCTVSASAVDRGATFLMQNGQPDGGWAYRPGTTQGPGGGSSTHNMTVAAAGSLAVARDLLHGQRAGKPKEKEKPKLGVLEKVDDGSSDKADRGSLFPDYSAQNSASGLDSRVDRAFAWNQARFQPVSRQAHKIYYYYALERAATLGDLEGNWFETYGDGLLSMQGPDGSFTTHSGPNVGTAFAILYFMRSTKQIVDKLYGAGIQMGGRDLNALLNPDAKKKRNIGELDDLLMAMQDIDWDELEAEPEEIVEKIQVSSRDELVGQLDMIRKLAKHKDGTVRAMAVSAMGPTGEFSLVPLLLEALRDPNMDVNAQALQSLRYISRKPQGLGIPDSVLAENPEAKGDEMVAVANRWRTKAYNAWSRWYFSVRPYSERDGLDQLQVNVPVGEEN